jgi:hypothetical protein
VDALKRLEEQLRERDEKLSVLLVDKAHLDAELARLREEVAAAKRTNAQQPDAHDYSEAETRDFFIDLLLKEAGWTLDKPQDREYPVTGMPNKERAGFVDYVLWGDDGQPVGLVEAKRTKRDARVGQEQARLYADCLERQFGQRPIIFYTNGYDHWLWDDTNHPPRGVQGFYTKAELELLIQRRISRKRLADTPINQAIVERVLPDARHQAHRGSPQTAESAQGARRDGNGCRQDAHSHRALRSTDPLQLGKARAVSGGSDRARESSHQRVQETSARLVARQSRDRPRRRGTYVRVHVPHDDGVDR